MKRTFTQLLLIFIVLGCHMEIPDPPVASFTFTPADCKAPCKVTFTSTSKNATTLEWDFDNGAEAKAGPETVEFEFLDGKDYYVKLVAKNADGGSHGVTQTVRIGAKPASLPEADFKVTLDKDGIAPSTASFQNLSKNAATYAWDFGDSLTSTTDNPNKTKEQSPKHTYTKPGKYIVSLISYNADNVASEPIKKVIEIKAEGPVADFKITNNECTAPCTVTFTDSSKNAKTYLWDFGDGTSSTDPSPKHDYEKDGTYNVTLTVTGDGGTNKTTQEVTIKKGVFNAVSIASEINTPSDIVADASGNIYVCGLTKGDTKFGDDRIFSSGPNRKNDFFVAKYNNTGQMLWAYVDGSAENDGASGIALDNNNDVYLTGYIGGSMRMNNVSWSGSTDGFVAKISGSSGNVEWFRAFGGTDADAGRTVAFYKTAFGNRVYLSGTITGDFSIGGMFFTGNAQDILFAFLNADTGEFIQSGKHPESKFEPRIIGGAGPQEVSSMVLDQNGNAYLTGTFEESIGFLPNARPMPTRGLKDAFLAKFSLDASDFQWATKASSSGNDRGYDVVVDNAGSIYMTGTHQGYLIELGVGSDKGEDNVFLGKWNSSGQILIGRNGFNVGEVDYPGGVAITQSGNILVAGSFAGTGEFPFGATKVETAGSTDLIISEVDANKCDPTGGFLVSGGGIGEERAARLCVSPDGFVYSTGYFSGMATFNETKLTSSSSLPNTYIVKYKR